jgi:tetratricopeptide (TPR) repeat protein
VRSSAAAGLADHLTPDVRDALLAATEDKTRLVRVRAASALAPFPRHVLPERDKRRLRRATEELKESLSCRQDDWSSHYNMGNFLSSRGDPRGALASYATASRLRPDAVPPYVNASMVHAGLGQAGPARQALETALELAPGNAAVNFNLGLLLAEGRELARAEKCLRAAMKADPKMAGAAYNLAILLSKDRPAEAVRWCRQAVELGPDMPRYAYMLALLLHRQGDPACEGILKKLVEADAPISEVYALLGMIYEKQGKADAAKAVYGRAMKNQKLPPRDRLRFEMRMRGPPRR